MSAGRRLAGCQAAQTGRGILSFLVSVTNDPFRRTGTSGPWTITGFTTYTFLTTCLGGARRRLHGALIGRWTTGKESGGRGFLLVPVSRLAAGGQLIKWILSGNDCPDRMMQRLDAQAHFFSRRHSDSTCLSRFSSFR